MIFWWLYVILVYIYMCVCVCVCVCVCILYLGVIASICCYTFILFCIVGRSEPITVSSKHAVNSNPTVPPFPSDMKLSMFGMKHKF